MRGVVSSDRLCLHPGIGGLAKIRAWVVSVVSEHLGVCIAFPPDLWKQPYSYGPTHATPEPADLVWSSILHFLQN